MSLVFRNSHKETADVDILVVARMSPRRNSRTRRLIRALSPSFRIRILSGPASGAGSMTANVDGARLNEITLPFQWLRVWHLGGLLRVLYLNLYGIAVAWKLRPRAVVCSDSLYCLPGLFSKVVLRQKFVYNSHEIMWGLGNPRILNALLGMLEKIAIHLCDFLMVPSEERARIILDKHALDKTYVVYENFPLLDGQEANQPSPRETPESVREAFGEPIVMFQGSLVRGRGIEELIKAAQSEAFHLIIQGAGMLVEEIREQVGPNVRLLDACSNNATVRWLSAADLSFVYYENDCPNSAYACPNKLYASVFAGVPVICNRLPALQAFADRYGGVEFFDALQPKDIEACIARALKPKRYSELEGQIRRAKQALESTSLEGRIASAFGALLPTDPI